jgi:hypothetical protein
VARLSFQNLAAGTVKVLVEAGVKRLPSPLAGCGPRPLRSTHPASTAQAAPSSRLAAGAPRSARTRSAV